MKVVHKKYTPKQCSRCLDKESFPTEYFTALEPQNQPTNTSELHKIIGSKVFSEVDEAADSDWPVYSQGSAERGNCQSLSPRSRVFLKTIEEKKPVFETWSHKSRNARTAWLNRWFEGEHGADIHYPEAIHAAGPSFLALPTFISTTCFICQHEFISRRLLSHFLALKYGVPSILRFSYENFDTQV